ncbi:hypothetical protein BD779DRAFT_1471282 [Infundibulicybe gibba]|nr:hypothetical protein BD779DRAFT_1471282 [Infundibulicybe gibba]
MFSKTIFLVAASFALLVAATPVPANTNSCNTGEMKCCNSVHQSDSSDMKNIGALVGIDFTGVAGQVGFKCSSITAVGAAGGSRCSQHPSAAATTTLMGSFPMDARQSTIDCDRLNIIEYITTGIIYIHN